MSFQRLALQIYPGVISSMLTDLELNAREHWGKSQFDAARTEHPATPHKEVESITIRNNEYPYMDGQLCEWQEAFWELSAFHGPIFDIARVVEAASIGRVIVTKLAPYGEIPPHTDIGEYCAAHYRAHLCLQGNRNTSFTCDGKTVFMKPGQVWLMDNKKLHSVRNPGPNERIHLIIDFKR